MSVDFRPVIPDPDPTPGRGNYTDLQPFRFWCQKVLPLVYDESLSYYEVLCKTVDYLNKTMEDVGVLNDDIDSLYTAFTNLTGWTETQVNALLEAYTELQSYVNTYFDNLDVQEEINAKLDAMALNGTLSALIQPFVTTQLPGIVTAWLNEHITEPEGVVIDTSLTISGAAADAKSTGDAIADVKGALNDKVYPIIGQEDTLFFASESGQNTNIYLIAGRTYTIKNITPSEDNQASGTLYIDGHSDNYINCPTRGNSVNFTPSFSGYLRSYASAGTIALKIIGDIDIKFKDLETSTKVVYIRGVGTVDGGNSGVTGNGQFFVHTFDKLLRFSKEYVNTTNFKTDTIQFDEATIYLYDKIFYKYSGSNNFDGLVKITEDIDFPVDASKVVYIRGVGTVGGGNSGVTGVNQFFVHALERTLKKSTSYTSATDFSNITIPFDESTLYVFEGSFYKYSGSNNFDGLIAVKNTAQEYKDYTIDYDTYNLTEQLSSVIDCFGVSVFIGKKLTTVAPRNYSAFQLVGLFQISETVLTRFRSTPAILSK